MTVGELSRRTRVPVKKLRQYQDRGLIYSLGRSPSGYRLFDDDAVWCVEAITTLRSLGLTEAEIQQLADCHDAHADGGFGPLLADLLATARERTRSHIDQLQQRLCRIDAFTRTHRAVLTGQTDTTPWDPTSRKPVAEAS